jgi:hypothetical protein
MVQCAQAIGVVLEFLAQAGDALSHAAEIRMRR